MPFRFSLPPAAARTIAPCALFLFVLCSGPLPLSVARADDIFAGFPPVNIAHPGNKSFDLITSDVVTGLLRPEWTRPMSDAGAWSTMFRFNGDIFLEFQSVDGHRGTNNAAATGATGQLIRYKSSDNGKTWTALPSWAVGSGTGEYVVAGKMLYRYGWDDSRKVTLVQTSTDGVNFTNSQDAYQTPFWLYGAMYDDKTKTFYAAPHAITDDAAQRQTQLRGIL